VGAIGGTSPYSWSITGTLPAGLSLNGSTGGISGTPTSAGTSSFSIQVHDSGGFSVSASYSLTITNNLDLVVADGDSITFGQGATTPYTGLLSLNGGPWSIINDGISGELLATMVANAPTKIDPLYANREGANIVVIWGGTNDFDQSATAADVYYDYVTYCLARHAAGWKVIVATKLSAQGQEADKDALNPLILANSSGCFDAIADFTGTPLGVDGGYANTTWFQSDGVHPTQAGITTYEAPIISAAINSLVP